MDYLITAVAQVSLKKRRRVSLIAAILVYDESLKSEEIFNNI